MPTFKDINHYINWALYAIYGQLAGADQLMRTAGDGIRRVAASLREQFPIERVTLYRGMLVDPTRPLAVDPSFSFWSWSENVDVARWFGSPDSYISGPFRQHHPEARGILLTQEVDPEHVLFHYAWSFAFGQSLPHLAMRHPLCGVEGAHQIAWSLNTQHEVITEPLAALPLALPIEDVPGPAIAELDRRLSPPWVAP